MVPVGRCRRRVHQELGALDALEVHVLVDSSFDLALVRLHVLEERCLRDVKLPVLVEEVLSCSGLPVVATRHQKRDAVVLDVSQQGKDALEDFRSLLLVGHLLWLHEVPLLVANGGGTRPARILSVDTIPRLLENVLDLFQSVEG